MTTSKDPIVDEIRTIRDRFAASHGYDIEEILRVLKKEAEDSGRQVVSLPPRPVAGSDKIGRMAR